MVIGQAKYGLQLDFLGRTRAVHNARDSPPAKLSYKQAERHFQKPVSTFYAADTKQHSDIPLADWEVASVKVYQQPS